MNGKVCTTDETELHIGDKICLLGNQKYFNFELCEDISDNTSTVPCDEPPPVAVETFDIERTFTEKILRQYECSICYETMALAHSLSCGDSFCFICISDWASTHSTCPICQSSFDLKLAIPNKTVTSAIRGTYSFSKLNFPMYLTLIPLSFRIFRHISQR